jgi:hypothetical protein
VVLGGTAVAAGECVEGERRVPGRGPLDSMTPSCTYIK